jgi:hypothetical protein
MSPEAKDFIQFILKLDPSDRPKLDKLLKHHFFAGSFPKLCSPSTLYLPPQNSIITHSNWNGRIPLITTPQKLNDARRPRSNVKNYLKKSEIYKESNHPSQDYGQESNIINLDSNYLPNFRFQWTHRQYDEGIHELQACVDVDKEYFRYLISHQLLIPQSILKIVIEKKPFKTRLPSVETPLRGPKAKDSDTPRTEDSQDSSKGEKQQLNLQKVNYESDRLTSRFQKATVHEDLKRSEGSTQSESQKASIKDVSIAKWVDYTRKYGIAYQLSNGNTGVLFNDETKMVYNPSYDRMHYFNGLDILVRCFDDFSTTPLEEYTLDQKKKVKILSYLKKILKKNDFPTSLTNKRNIQSDDSIVYLKKWSKTSGKLIFKLNTKLMQIVKPDNSEILLKYDIGQAEFYKTNGEIKSASLSTNSRKFIFSGNKTLSEKLDLIEAILEGTSIQENKSPTRDWDFTKMTATFSRLETYTNDKTYHVSNTPLKDSSTFSTLRKKRTRINLPITYSSMSVSAFKGVNLKAAGDLHASTATDFGKYVTKSNRK